VIGTPTRDRRAERREATRLEILDTAWAVAREGGLAQLTLRDVAERIGMRAPSLYTHFASKNAIYDAMYQQAWTECSAVISAAISAPLAPPRAGLRKLARTFFDFATADLARHQLMNQRTIPGFAPSAQAYEPAVEALTMATEALRRLGVGAQRDVDLYVAITGGLVGAQLANDPGGDRWSCLLEDAMDMLADHVGLPIAEGAGNVTHS
jgi:AcrR family transcriptional regulator